MKAVIVTICFWLLAVSANAWYDTKYDTLEVHWPSGNLKEYVTRASHLGNEKGFLPHGIYRSYHENGQLGEEGHYDYNVKIGSWNYWDSKGNRTRDIIYKEGILSCQYCEWHPDHRLKLVGHYSNGKKNGLWIRTRRTTDFMVFLNSAQYFIDGILLVDLEEYPGKSLHAENKFYNIELDLWVEWKRGNYWRSLYNYQEFSIGEKIEGLKSGEWQVRNSNGELIRTEFYENGELKN